MPGPTRAGLAAVLIGAAALLGVSIMPAEAAGPNAPAATGVCADASLRGAARALCTNYCEVLDCDGSPRASHVACERIARAFRAQTHRAPPCAGPDADGDGIEDPLDNCPFDFNPGQEDSFEEPGVGDACDCPCFTTSEAAALIDQLSDPETFADLACLDTRPAKPLTAVRAVRLDGAACSVASQDCSAVAVTFTEDNACQLNPPAPEPGVVVQGISDAQREACRGAILDAAIPRGLTCS